jgi:hypothetical protein
VPRGIKDIITRGWGDDAAARPSFEEIWRVLEQIKLSFTPSADIGRVTAFVAAVRQSEAQ